MKRLLALAPLVTLLGNALSAASASTPAGVAELGQWCNTTLPAQEKRRKSLELLLAQTQVTETPSLKELEEEIKELSDKLEKQRVAKEEGQSDHQRALAQAELDADLAMREAQALQDALDHMPGVGNQGLAESAPHEGAALLQQLLSEASVANTNKKKHAETGLVQTESEPPLDKDFDNLQAAYESKKQRFAKLRKQFFTTRRSLAVLTMALEDESAYLADLGAVCDMGTIIAGRAAGQPEEPAAKTNGGGSGAPPPAKEEADREAYVKSRLDSSASKSEPTPARVNETSQTAAANQPQAASPMQVHVARPAGGVAEKVAAATTAAKAETESGSSQNITGARPQAAEKASDSTTTPAATRKEAHEASHSVPVDQPAAPMATHSGFGNLTAKAPIESAKPVPQVPSSQDPVPAKAQATQPTPPAHETSRSLVADQAKLASTAQLNATPAVGTNKEEVPATTSPAAPAGGMVSPLKVTDAKAQAVETVSDSKPPSSAAKTQAHETSRSIVVDRPKSAMPVRLHAAASSGEDRQKATATTTPATPATPSAEMDSSQSVATATKPAVDSVSASTAMPTVVAAARSASDIALPQTTTIASPDVAASGRTMDVHAPQQTRAVQPSTEDVGGQETVQPRQEAPTPTPVLHTTEPPASVPETAPTMQASPSAASNAQPKQAKQPKNSRSEFLDSIYNSAGGMVPSGYSAWHPEDMPQTQARTPALVGDAVKSMSSILGEVDSDWPGMNSSTAAASTVQMHASSVSKASAGRGAPGPAEAPATSVPIAPTTSSQIVMTTTTPSKFTTTIAAEPSKVTTTLAAESLSLDDEPAAKRRDAAAPRGSLMQEDAVPEARTKSMGGVQADADNDDSLAAMKDADSPARIAKPRAQALADMDGDDSLAGTQQEAAASRGHANFRGGAPTQASGEDSDSLALAKQDPTYAKMAAMLLDDDDDTSATRAPPRKPLKKLARGRAKVVQTTTAAPAADNVVYDDDDLPKHKPQPLSLEFSGGWRSMISNRPAPAKPKRDEDLALMESLYTSDGNLPSQYSAWVPTKADPDTDHTAVSLNPFADQAPVSLVQASATPRMLPKAPRIAKQAAKATIASSSAKTSGAVFLHRSATRVEVSKGAAASALLRSSAKTVASEALRQLAEKEISAGTLSTFAQRLEDRTKEGAYGALSRAAQQCEYFRRHEQSAAPLHTAVAAAESADAELGQASDELAALSEETAARTQMQKTVRQDVGSLSAMLDVERRLGQQGLADALEAMTHQRAAVLDRQSKDLAHLEDAVHSAGAGLVELKLKVQRARAGVDAARSQLQLIRKSCDATSQSLARRKQYDIFEAWAAETALKVLLKS